MSKGEAKRAKEQAEEDEAYDDDLDVFYAGILEDPVDIKLRQAELMEQNLLIKIYKRTRREWFEEALQLSVMSCANTKQVREVLNLLLIMVNDPKITKTSISLYFSAEESLGDIAAISAATQETTSRIEPVDIAATSAVNMVTTKRSRGPRAGRRVKKKQPGYCYGKLLRRKDQAAAFTTLKANPLLSEFCEYVQPLVVRIRHLKFLRVTAGHAHVVWSPQWETQDQAVYLLKHAPHLRIGVTASELQIMETERVAREFFKAPHNVQVEAPKEIEYEEVPTKIGGSGDCWKKLPIPYQYRKKDIMTVTECLQLMDMVWGFDEHDIEDGRVWYSIQSDGDLHIEDFAVKIGNGRLKTGIEYVADELVENYITWEQWIDVLKDSQAKLIGKPSVSPLDTAMSKFSTPEVRRTLETLTSTKIAHAVKEVQELCPYAVPPAVQHHMDELKLPWSITNATPMGHVVHNSVRRWECKRALPHHINTDVTLVSMQEGNVKWVKAALADKNHDFQVKVVNPIIDLQDPGRYLEHPETIPKDVFKLPALDTETVVFHNSGHYMSDAMLMKLSIQNPAVKFWILTFVYPMDALVSQTSLKPDLYKYTFSWKKGRKVMTYVPEDDVGNAYEQDADPGLLVLKEIQSKCGKYRLKGGIVESKLNTHVMVWSSYNLETKNFVPILVPKMMEIPRLFRSMPKDLAMIRTDDYVAMFQYSKTLLTAKEQDYWGKMRQFVDTTQTYIPVGDKTWLIKVVEEAAKIDMTFSLQTKQINNFAGEAYYKTVGHLVRLWDKAFAARYGNRHRAMVNEPYTLRTIELATSIVRWHGAQEYSVKWKYDPSIIEDYEHRIILAKEKVSDVVSKVAHEINADVKRRMWMLWSHLKGAEHVDVERMTISRNGTLVFDREVAMTWRNIMTFSISQIETTQIRSFNVNILKRAPIKPALVKHRVPPKIVFENPPLPERHPRIFALPEDEGDEDWSFETHFGEFVKDADDYDADGESSGSTTIADDESDARSDTTLEYLDEAEANHCDECQVYSMFKVEYPHLTHTEYLAFCEKVHMLKTQFTASNMQDVESRLIFNELKVENQKRQDNIKEIPEVPVTVEDIDSQPTPPVEEIISPQVKQKRVVEQLPDELRVDALQVVKTELDVKVKRVVPYETCKSDWEKLMKAKPHGTTITHNYRGKDMWDALYPKSVDKRIRQVPYHHVISYPLLPYPKEDCLLEALHRCLGRSHAEILFRAIYAYPADQLTHNDLSVQVLEPIGIAYGAKFIVRDGERSVIGEYGMRQGLAFELKLSDGHFTAVKSRSGMIIKSLRTPKGPEPPLYKVLMDAIRALPAINFVPWVPEPTRASKYVRAMLDKSTGTIWQTSMNEEKLRSWEEMTAMMSQIDVERWIAIVEGDPGCRKSSALQNLVASVPGYLRNRLIAFVMATVVLAGDYKQKLGVQTPDKLTGRGAPGNVVTTFEKALVDQAWAFTVVTDEDKYPKGYHALMAIMFPWIRHHIFMCDRYQSEWHEPNDKCQLNDADMLGEAAFYSQYSKQYFIGTWRFGPNIANFFRMPTFNQDQGQFHFSETDLKRWEDLKPYFPNSNEVDLKRKWDTAAWFYASHAGKTWASEMKGRDVDTFAGSQGLSAELAFVEVDVRCLRMVDYRIWYTVLTRAKDVIILKSFINDGINAANLQANEVLRKLFYYHETYYPGKVIKIHPENSVDMKALIKPLPKDVKKVLAGPPHKVKNLDFVLPYLDFDYKTSFIDPDNPVPRGGRRLQVDEPAYIENFDMRARIDQTPYRQVEEYVIQSSQMTSRKVATHLPPSNIYHLDELHSGVVTERFQRELSYKTLFSTQMPDVYMHRTNAAQVRVKLKKKMYPNMPRRQAEVKLQRYLKTLDDDQNPLLFKPDKLNWGQYQLSSDPVSFALGVQQRIKYATLEENQQNYIAEEAYGIAMFHAYCKYMNWDPGEIVPLSDYEIDTCKLEFLERRGARSEALKKMGGNRASPDFQDMLTAKTQWKMKDHLPPDAKPLQTIMIRSDEYLFKLGWVGVLLLKKMLATQPDYYYWHANRSLDEMKNWFSQHMPFKEHEMLDLSALDTSVRGGAVHLMRLIMRRFSVPQELIDYYVEDKLDFHTKKIHIAIMTFSGELFTWLINGTFVTARECLKYDLTPGDPMANSGDDLDRAAGKVISEEWNNWIHFDACIEKRFTADVGEFCSFKCNEGVLYKDPIILYKRLRGQLSRGKVDEIALGYFDLFAQNYELGDLIYEVMTEAEAEHASAINHIMFNIRKFGYDLPLPWSKLSVGELDRFVSGEVAGPQFMEAMVAPVKQIMEDISNGSTYTVDTSLLW
jgi:hypothetical protein